MQAGIWNGLTHSFWLQGFGHIKIQTSGLSLDETRWLWRHLCQQDAAFCSRCRTPEWIICRTAQKINHGWSARVTRCPPFCILLGMLKNKQWLRFYHKGKPSMPLVTFTHTQNLDCALHHTCPEKKEILPQHMNTLPHTAPLSLQRIKMAGKVSPSTLQSRPSPLRHPSIWVCKGSDERLEFYDQWGSPEAVYCCLWTAEMEFHCRRIFKISRMMAKMYHLGWGICTEVNTVGTFVSHYVFS